MAAGSARLFIALWPSPALRDALVAWRDQQPWPAPARPTPAQQLHLTLHFLGAVPRERCSALRTALRQPFAPFTLLLGRPALWPGGTVVLEPLQLPPQLAQLHTTQDIGRVPRRLAERGMPGVDRGPLALALVEQCCDFAAELGDRYLLMERGEVAMSGRSKEMQADGVRRGGRSEAVTHSFLRTRCCALGRPQAASGSRRLTGTCPRREDEPAATRRRANQGRQPPGGARDSDCQALPGLRPSEVTA